jgi:peptide/nickel transport system ATP-binding protein
LTCHFRAGGLFARGTLHAVDDLNLSIGRREIVALVGESGSGKSTIARLFAMLYKPTRGEIFFEGRPLSGIHSRKERLAYRRDVPMIFQDPFASLNPTYRVSHGILRSMKLHRPELSHEQRVEAALWALDAVGLVPATDMLVKFPYELSGGQRQRVGFAEALVCRPKLILADEPVSMLDVSIRVGILNLMADLREREGVSLLYITHDIASARYIADRVLVLYGGQLVEEGPADEVLQQPKHPYTQLLLSAVPNPQAELSLVDAADVGEPPKVVNPKEGCRFRHRCPFAIDQCDSVTPKLRLLRPDHRAACHVAEAEPLEFADSVSVPGV